jgi:hypothetical protein
LMEAQAGCRELANGTGCRLYGRVAACVIDCH